MARKDTDKNKENKDLPHFPFHKMPFQEKEESEEALHDYDSDEELDLGESPKRQKKRMLRDEDQAGREP